MPLLATLRHQNRSSTGPIPPNIDGIITTSDGQPVESQWEFSKKLASAIEISFYIDLINNIVVTVTVTGNTITNSYTDLCVPRAQMLELSNYSRYTRVTFPALDNRKVK